MLDAGDEGSVGAERAGVRRPGGSHPRTGWVECILEAVDTARSSLTSDPPRIGTASVSPVDRWPLLPCWPPGGAQHTALGPVSSDSLLGVAVGGWCGHTGAHGGSGATRMGQGVPQGAVL